MDSFEKSKVEINTFSPSYTTKNPRTEEQNEPSNCKCSCACCTNNHEQNLQIAGWRFVPKDDELIVDYLMRKLANQQVSGSYVHDVELYNTSPQELTGKYPPVDNKADTKEWYFFTPRERKYPNGQRPKRAAGIGYWKATGADKDITREGVVVGSKKALKFYIGSARNKGGNTNWIMQEFRTNDPKEKEKINKSKPMRLNSSVLCKIYQNNRQSARNQHDNADNSEEGNPGRDEGITEEDNSEENETNGIPDQQTDENENESEATDVAFDENPEQNETNNGIGANQQLENPEKENPFPSFKYVHQFQSQIQQPPKMMRSHQGVTSIAPAVQGQSSNFPQVNNGFIRNPFFNPQQQEMANIEFPVLPDVNNGLQSNPVVTQPIFLQENSDWESYNLFDEEMPLLHRQVFNDEQENNRWRRASQFVHQEPPSREQVINGELNKSHSGFDYRSCEDKVTSFDTNSVINGELNTARAGCDRSCEDKVTSFDTNSYHQYYDPMIQQGTKLDTNIDGHYFYDLSAHKRRRFETK